MTDPVTTRPVASTVLTWTGILLALVGLAIAFVATSLFVAIFFAAIGTIGAVLLTGGITIASLRKR